MVFFEVEILKFEPSTYLLWPQQPWKATGENLFRGKLFIDWLESDFSENSADNSMAICKVNGWSKAFKIVTR